ncbi:MAG: hypothetical protein Q9191_006606 [Dirinaria sp. TL-2023a]
MAPTRIAILDCDPLTEAIRKTYGDYGGVVAAFFRAGAECIGLPFDELTLSVWNVDERQVYPGLEEVDSIVITGSRFSAYDDIEWIDKLVEYVRQVLAHHHVTIIGLCFGHQIVGRALGAKGAINSLGYEMSVCKVDMLPLGAKMFGVTPLGTSPVCEVQGMYLPRKLITLQGHPEFNEEIMLELLKAGDAIGFTDKTLYSDAMNRVYDKHDGTLIAAAMLEFVRGELDV